MSYVMTNMDRFAINELLKCTYIFDLKVHSERQLKYSTFSIMAPSPDKTFYTTNGLTIKEAVDNWFEKMHTLGHSFPQAGEHFTSMYEEKLDLIEVE